MIFVKSNNRASGFLRADQIANELGAQVLINDLPEELSGTVVFVKEANPGLVMRAKEAGCRIVYDPIDTFAYADRLVEHPWYKHVDVCIAYNKKMAKLMLEWFPETRIIPHQWDNRLKLVVHDAFRVAYIGHRFNCPEIIKNSGIDMISDPFEMIEQADRYSCHVSVRDQNSLEAMMKPATKLVTAAAVGAVIITSPDASVRELLPINYPYVCFNPDEFQRILEKARHDYGNGIWEFALAQMREIRDKTSLYAISKLYLDL